MTPPPRLDTLPHSLLIRIAIHLSPHGCLTPHALSFAETSPRLRRAVLAAVNHSLDTPSSHDLSREAALLSSTIHTLRDLCAHSPDPAFYTLLAAPTLRHVRVFDDPAALTALTISACVESLELIIQRDASHPGILAALRALPLSTLTLYCHAPSLRTSLAASPLADPTSPNSIPALCPDLHTFAASCTRDRSHAVFWALLPHLGALRTVTLDHAPRRKALLMLRGLQDVRIRAGVTDAVFHAERLAPAVTELCTMDALDAGDIGIVRACTRLRRLEIGVKVGEECGLPALVEGLPELEALRLDWSRAVYGTGKRRRGKYAVVEDGVLRQVVRAAREVRKLGLVRVSMEWAEMEGLLEECGERLDELEISLKGQEEGMFERLERVLVGVGKWNRGVKRVKVSEAFGVEEVRRQMRPKGKKVKRKEQRELGERLRWRLCVLRRKTRLESSEDLERLIGVLL